MPAATLKPPRLTREAVDAVFEQAQSQQEYVLRLHALVVPDFDRVEGMNGYVAVSRDMWLYIADKAIAWDKAHLPPPEPGRPGVMPGGAWLNWGFTTDERCRGGQVKLPPGITYKKEVKTP